MASNALPGWRTLLDLDDPAPRWGWIETLLLLVWFLAAGFGLVHHTPWADEMQAWLLADGESWRTLFTSGLHYEGTGGLWHAFLKLLQAGSISFNGMRWLVLGIEGASMALLLRYAPLPRLVRWVLPFSFFFFYQDAIVVRSYCLFALLAFASAMLLRGGRPRPLLLAGLLGLLANLSVHGAVLSLGLALTAALLWRRRFLRSAPAIVVLLALWSVNIATMVPAFDIDYAAGNNLRRSTAKFEQQLGFHASMPPSLVGLPLAGLSQVHFEPHVRSGFHKVWNRIARTFSVVTYPLSTSPLLALLLTGLIVRQALTTRRKQTDSTAHPRSGLGPIGLLPYAAMLLVFSSLYLAPRHTGTIFTGFIVMAWLTWPGHVVRSRRDVILSRLTACVFALTCLLQVGWSAHALMEERTHPYGPGRMTADFLQSRGVASSGTPAKTVAGYYYFSIDPLLYFPRNIYLNQPPHRYWEWSTRSHTYSTVQDVLRRHPDFIVVGGFDEALQGNITDDWEERLPLPAGVELNDTYQLARFFKQHGYRETHLFCGHSWMRSAYAETLCDTVLEPRVP